MIECPHCASKDIRLSSCVGGHNYVEMNYQCYNCWRRFQEKWERDKGIAVTEIGGQPPAARPVRTVFEAAATIYSGAIGLKNLTDWDRLDTLMTDYPDATVQVVVTYTPAVKDDK